MTSHREEPPVASVRSRRIVTARRLAAATLVALAFALVLGRDTDLTEIARRLRELPPGALLVAYLWLALAGLVRAVRLRRLLATHVPVGRAYAFHQLYNVVTAVVPTGLGEAASAWLLRRALRVPLHLGLVALLVGRLLDLAVLLGLFLLVLLGGAVRITLGGDALVTAAAAMLTVLLLLAVAHATAGARFARRLDAWALQIHSDHPARRLLRRGLSLLGESLRLLPHGMQLWALVVLTLATQLLSLAALHALLGASGLELGYAEAIVCFVVYVLFRMLPLQGVGGIGTTAAWWAIALRALSVPAGEAATVGAVLYVAFTALLVLLCLTSIPLMSRGARDSTPHPSPG